MTDVFASAIPHTVRICHCELTGYIHLLEDGSGCELCDSHAEFNLENVKLAFKWYQEQLEQEHKLLVAEKDKQIADLQNRKLS